MKISVDGQDLFELNETQKKVIQHEVCSDIFDEDMKRRLQWVLTHKYEVCFENFKKEWDAKLLSNGVDMIPSHPDRYAELVFAQPNYKCRKKRDMDSQGM